MAISSGFQKVKDYIKQPDGTFKLLSRWTSSQTVEYSDGKTAQEKNGVINGITSDVNCEDPTIAASASMVGALNQNLGGVSFNPLTDGLYATYKVGADTVVKKLGDPELLYQTKGSNYPAFSNGLNWYTFNFPNKMIGIASISVQGGNGRPDMNAEYSRYDYDNQRVGIYWVGAGDPYRGYVSVTAVGY